MEQDNPVAYFDALDRHLNRQDKQTLLKLRDDDLGKIYSIELYYFSEYGKPMFQRFKYGGGNGCHRVNMKFSEITGISDLRDHFIIFMTNRMYAYLKSKYPKLRE